MFELFVLQGSQGNPFIGMLPLLGIIVVFYFFFMRPQQKRQKAQDRFQKELQKGDQIVTTSGILGTINKIEGDIITVQLDSKTFIRIMRSAISKEMTDSVQKGENAAVKA